MGKNTERKKEPKSERSQFNDADAFLIPQVDVRPPKKTAYLIRAFDLSKLSQVSGFRLLAEKIDSGFHLLTLSIGDQIHRERESGAVLTLAMLAFCLGICVYFLGQFEPILWVSVATSLILAFLCVRMNEHGRLWVLICMSTMFFAGVAISGLRTTHKDTITLHQQVTSNVTGTIIEVTRNSRGAPRYQIVVDAIEKLPAHDTPKLIRLSAHAKHRKGKPGDTISGLARIQPVTGPVYPGGFDFSFNHWFRGLGGTGFFMGAPKTTLGQSNKPNINLVHRYDILINHVREKISSRIRSAIQGEKSDIAVALIVGDRSGISQTTQQSLRNSGLAHVLAISGMHMALVSLTFIWSVRLLLSLNQNLVQSAAIKNWAALAGFFIATSYLAISGLSVATQRAWIMISVVLLATLVNRKALTMRSVVVAAFIVLFIQPESILSPGFQMSFAAVAAIIAAWEWQDRRAHQNRQKGFLGKIFGFIATLAFTSLIAGMATSIIAAWHFQQFAVYGVVTNLLAMPIVSLAIMPLALLGVLLMPYGFEHFALVLMGYGVDAVVWISAWVNQWGDVHITGKLAATILPLTGIGIFILTMFSTRLRFLALIPLLLLPVFWQTSGPPDVLLAEDGRTIAVKTADGMSLLYPRRGKFVTDIWKKSWPDQWVKDESQFRSKPNNCDKNRCIRELQTGGKLYVVYDPKLLRTACNNADILLAPRLRWVNCYGEEKPALIVKRGDLEEFGSHSIYFSKNQKGDDIGGEDSNSATNPKQIKPVTRTQIERIKTAYTHSSRPWLARRNARAQYLQDE